MRPVVFDSWALLAYFGDEKGADEVQKILTKSIRNQRGKYLSLISLGEIWYILFRRHGRNAADQVRHDISALGIETVGVDEELTLIAAELKAGGGLSYADAFAAATTLKLKGELVTGDPEFNRLHPKLTIRFIGSG